MGALDLSIVGPVIPAIEKSMQVHGHNLSWIFSIYLLFYLFGLPLMSKLSDRHGRKSIYIVSLSIFAFGSFLVFLSHDFTLLLIGRAIQGFGSSGVFPVAAATIGDVFPFEKRGRALGILGAVYGIAFILGPIIAGTMLHFFNWNAIFLINIPIAILLIVLAVKLLPGKPVGDKPSINWLGIILMIIVLSGFSLAINNIDVTNVTGSLVSWSVLPFIISVLILTPILVMFERKQANSFLSMDFFKSKQLRLVGIISFGLGLFQSSIVFIPKLAVELFSVTPSKASFMLLPLVLATAIVPPISGRLLDKIGSRIIIFCGLAFAVISLIMFSLLSNDIPFFYAAEAALGIGLAIRSSLKYIILNEIAKKERAASLGMLIIIISLGQLAGAAFFGIIISGSESQLMGFGSAFLNLTIITALLIFLSFFLKNRKKEMATIETK
jgi:multidrug resistance protein